MFTEQKYVVVHSCRGWEFTSIVMSKKAADECAKDFQWANPDVPVSAITIQPVKE